MALHAGHYVWVPCEVKPGPFSDERLVRMNFGSEDWLGYVPVSHLQESILAGRTKIRVLIVDVHDDSFCAKIPGDGVSGTFYCDLISKAQAFDTISA